MKSTALASFVTTVAIISGCGGGDSSTNSNNDTATPSNPTTSSPAILTVNKDGIYKTIPFTPSPNYIQNPTSGYFVSSGFSTEWAGAGLAYTNGYILPTSGTLKSSVVTDGATGALMYSMSNLNYDISKSAPSTLLDKLYWDAFNAAAETKILGGPNNDTSGWLGSTTEVDLASGSDTLEFSQNYAAYKFERVAGNITAIYASRDTARVLVKNVETLKFSDGTRTVAQVLATLP
jgi:hypothetical protein